MRFGTTSFGYRYRLLDPAVAPPLETLVSDAHGLGLEILQICENARPLTLSVAEWNSIWRGGQSLGIEVQLGCKTLDVRELAAYVERALMLPRPFLRVVLEIENGPAPTSDQVSAFLCEAWRWIEPTQLRLAIENHFDVPSAVLAEALAPYPPDRIGTCVDTANSLRNFESPGEVMRMLGPRALCYHLKDFDVKGHQLGFCVEGAKLGQGRLDVDWFFACIPPDSDVLLENWVPMTGDRDTDIAADTDWLGTALRYVRR